MTAGRIRNMVFLNSVSEAQRYLGGRDMGMGAKDTLLISMHPAVRAHLKRKGVASCDTAEFFATNSHVATLKRSEELVKWIEENAAFGDAGLGVKKAYLDFFIYWLRFAIHNCIWVIETASSAMDAFKPETVYAYSPGPSPVSGLYIEDGDGSFGVLIGNTARAKGIEFRNLCENGHPEGSKAGERSMYIRSLVRFILQNIKFSLWEMSVRARNIFSGKRPVYFTTRFYNLDKLAKEFTGKDDGRRAETLRGPVIFKYGLPGWVIRMFGGAHSAAIISQEGMFERLERRITEEPALFSFKGADFSGIISRKIRENIGDHIMGLMLWTVKLDRFIGRSKALLFVSNGNRADDVILAELCAKRGVRTLLVSHGSHVRPKNEPERIEWGEHGRALLRAPFSDIALQTPVAEGYIDAFGTESRVIRTGPLIWGRPVERRKSAVRTIVHAGTPKAANSLRPFVYETPDEYIRGICELAAAVEGIQGAVLIVRFRPSPEISAEDIKDLVPFSDKVKLSIDGPFSAALGSADLLVSFSSTTIEEALQNRIPVLLYGGQGRYSHIPAYEVEDGSAPVERSAAYHVRGPGGLLSAIEGILRLGIDGQGRDKELFNRFIYPEGERISLEKIIDETCR